MVNNQLSRIKLTAHDLTLSALLDSDAARSVISFQIFRLINNKCSLSITPTAAVSLFDVQGKQLDILGTCVISPTYGNDQIQQQVIITNAISEDLIFGMDAITRHGLVLNEKRESFICQMGRKELQGNRGQSTESNQRWK